LRRRIASTQADRTPGNRRIFDRETAAQISAPIVYRVDSHNVISGRAGGIDPRDARTLVRLGLFLGFAYVLFVVLWLWKTRGRPHRAGRIVRY